ncbi:MAG: cytochrome C oxidase subunit I [Herminiimonas sp.]|uniref:SCO family protein n=1 Tax=Herminiimonas sp. TaxID=1926289 RepID=UPI002716BE5F|nr:cytochrome C oxidase subunit I [Herminiimonas sp.]MDO9421808.1 cytochrome C oxidase subunit I [Herminiimonas sp.]MDO9421837.1 cytochrome C oxidase subunit I [Herminiimonas sp.]
MEKSKNKGRWKLLAVILVCASPIILSYLTYYVIKPQSRTNYGAFIDPRDHPIPALGTTTLDGKPIALDAYKGKWIMLQVDGGECPAVCEKKLHDIRQLRLAQGKEMERIERVWLITDNKPLDTILIREFDGTNMLRAKADVVRGWLPVEEGTTISDHIFMIDPLGNLMMRFPKDADPNKIKKDVTKLLKASSIG